MRSKGVWLVQTRASLRTATQPRYPQAALLERFIAVWPFSPYTKADYVNHALLGWSLAVTAGGRASVTSAQVRGRRLIEIISLITANGSPVAQVVRGTTGQYRQRRAKPEQRSFGRAGPVIARSSRSASPLSPCQRSNSCTGGPDPKRSVICEGSHPAAARTTIKPSSENTCNDSAPSRFGLSSWPLVGVRSSLRVDESDGRGSTA